MKVPPKARIAGLLVMTAALAAAAIGVSAMVGPAGPAESSARVGGLTASVGDTGWLGMDHDMSTTASGYQMPPAMMPGMPASGDDRLSVAVTVVNTGTDTVTFHPATEFTLHAGPAATDVAVYGGTFGELPRLGPGAAITGTLFFDLPPASLDRTAWLDWNRPGGAARLSIPDAAMTMNH
ncbi:DUF4352 domain-containing protein [Kutzneria chonburiensis]|uniref:DUF4352 domain-containing protein n=1 Tax=Kutzneria chonburiensis TaxID=1483604 RepID=A0ABV6MJX5_9PSEU|nr:DUF4352 domain-containing protein [Kutzneria chonburiensis]